MTPLTVYVAGIPLPAASVSYQGLTVDAGLYQINFVVPADAYRQRRSSGRDPDAGRVYGRSQYGGAVSGIF